MRYRMKTENRWKFDDPPGAHMVGPYQEFTWNGEYEDVAEVHDLKTGQLISRCEKCGELRFLETDFPREAPATHGNEVCIDCILKGCVEAGVSTELIDQLFRP
jgi:hypothetical protein